MYGKGMKILITAKEGFTDKVNPGSLHETNQDMRHNDEGK